MVDYTINFFGWCYHEEDGKVKNDKIWGYVEVEGKLYNFWGRRGGEAGKALKFKRHNSDRWSVREVEDLARKKLNPGGGKVPYQRIGLARVNDQYVDIDAIYPGFDTWFTKQLAWARLSGQVRNEIV